MKSQQNQQKIKAIYRMLLEIVNGNLEYRIGCDGSDIQFNELAKALNEVAEKMKSAGYTSPFVNPQKLRLIYTLMYQNPSNSERFSFSKITTSQTAENILNKKINHLIKIFV